MRVVIDGAEALEAARKSFRATREQAAKAAVDGVNRVARSIAVETSLHVANRYNLPSAYVNGLFSVGLARGEGGVALVSARRRAIRLARFGAMQLTAAAPRAKGDRTRGIAPGRKQAGVSVQVMRGGARHGMRRTFFVPMRAGKVDGGNGMGMFVRIGQGRKAIRPLYGPAPWQAFRWMLREQIGDIKDRVTRTVLAELQLAMKRKK